MNKKIAPDQIAITAHLDFLFGGQTEGLIEIAYTPQTSSAVSSAKFFPVSEILKAAEFAANQNAKEGSNVYVGAALRNPNTAPFGRSDINDYFKSTAIWCDLDDAEAAKTAKEKYKGLPPSFVVVTGRHPNLRAQVWWKLQEPQSDPVEHKKALANVCAALDGDKSVVDPIRVMRLGGTVAWPKKDGRIPEATETTTPPNALKSVTMEAFKDYFPAVAPPVDTKATVGEVGHLNLGHKAGLNLEKESWSIDQVCDMLNHIHPDGEYIDWVKVGMGLKDYGVPFEIFDSWCSKGAKYKGSQDCRYKWDSFKGKGTGIGTVYHHAANGGYHPSKYRPQPMPKDVQSYTQEVVDKNTGEIKNEIKPPKNGKTLPLVYAEDIGAVTDTSDFVEDLLRDEEFSVIYGQSNCGKTFFMLDLAMHVALGREWRGKAVEQGGVIYAALEGGHGTKNRIVAFREHYGIKEAIPLAIIPSSINFLDDESDMPAFLQAVMSAKERLGRVRLIVVDTLARAISGGDENSSSDMGKLIINADALRKLTGAHICFVHHSGKDELRGARGHSSLRAAVDTEIEISRLDTVSPSKIKIVKQREMEMIEEMAFSLTRIVLGENKRGKEITSCIVMPADVVEKDRREDLTPMQLFVYESIVEALSTYGQARNVVEGHPPFNSIKYDELRVVMESRGGKEFFETEKKTTAEQIKSATFTARAALKKKGKINMSDGYIWLV